MAGRERTRRECARGGGRERQRERDERKPETHTYFVSGASPYGGGGHTTHTPRRGPSDCRKKQHCPRSCRLAALYRQLLFVALGKCVTCTAYMHSADGGGGSTGPSYCYSYCMGLKSLLHTIYILPTTTIPCAFPLPTSTREPVGHNTIKSKCNRRRRGGVTHIPLFLLLPCSHGRPLVNTWPLPLLIHTSHTQLGSVSPLRSRSQAAHKLGALTAQCASAPLLDVLVVTS